MSRGHVPTKRGSALLLSLGVLALLAIMGTTFVTMTRMDSKLNAHYVDDVQCEMLARGMLEYVRGILVDDQDRSMRIISNSLTYPVVAQRYENRDTGGPFVRSDGGFMLTGVNTDDNVRNTNVSRADEFTRPGTSSQGRFGLRLGIPPSNDFWLCLPNDSRNQANASRSAYVASGGWQHQGQTGSFYCGYDEVTRFAGTIYWKQVVRDYVDPQVWDYDKGDWAYTERVIPTSVDTNGVGYDVWATLCQNTIDDNPWASGGADPGLGTSDYDPERSVWANQYHDTCSSFLTPGGPSLYLQGPRFVGDAGLPGGRYWRMAVRVVMPEGGYFNANMIGNAQGTKLTDMDGAGLGGARATKYGATSVYRNYATDIADYGPNHMGLMGFTAYSGDDALPYTGNPNNPTITPYDAVCYSPLQISLKQQLYDARTAPLASWFPLSGDQATAYGNVCNAWADKILQARYGGTNKRPAATSSHEARYQVGWRADGGSYYVIPNPENPIGTDTPFGAEEVLEHATPTHMVDDNSACGSRFFNVAYHDAFNGSLVDTRYYTLLCRSRLSALSRDTILRGKIWFTEKHGKYADGANHPELGIYQVPTAMQNQAGEWRSIAILKRVNLNMLGATNTGWPGDPNGTTYLTFPPNGLTSVKQRWIAKRQYEQDRCYYMLKGALKWYYGDYWDASGAHRTNAAEAEQLAAKGACQLIAALTDMIDRDQDETKYVAPDSSGAIGWGTERFPVINEVGLEIKSTGTIEHFRVELFNPMENIPWLPDAKEAIDLSRYSIRILTNGGPSHSYALSGLDSMGKTSGTFDSVQGKCTSIGMGGAKDGGSKSANRYLHVKLDSEVKRDFTLANLTAGVQVELIKNTRVGGERVVDRAASWGEDGSGPREYLKLATYNDGTTSSATTFSGIYRRVDPTNAKTYKCTGRINQCSVVHAERNLDYSGISTFGSVNSYATNTALFKDATTYNYVAQWCKDIKVPDADLPSIGWLGEAFLYTYMDPDQGPITERNDRGQPSLADLGNKYTSYSSIDRTAKLNLFKPFGNSRNVHILDIFTCWDPSNDGEDNDGDGLVDEDDEVVVHGRLDVNAAGGELWAEIFGIQSDRTKGMSFTGEQGTMKLSTSYPRTLAGRTDQAPDINRWIQYAHPGPRETIGDMVRCGKLSVQPGWSLGGSSIAMPTSYSRENNPYLSWDDWDPDRLVGASSYDDDGDGKWDEVDERDGLFTWYANLLTTRNSVFTVEIVTELTAPPYYPGHALQHGCYKIQSDSVRSRKHLLAVLDRSQTLRVASDGTCDFTGPVKVLVQRWAQTNQ